MTTLDYTGAAGTSARRTILLRRARLTPDGLDPVRCWPSDGELEHARLHSETSDGRPVFDSKRAATAAARELEACGTRALRPYWCRRSESWRPHFHLTTDRATRTTRGPDDPARQ